MKNRTKRTMANMYAPEYMRLRVITGKIIYTHSYLKHYIYKKFTYPEILRMRYVAINMQRLAIKRIKPPMIGKRKYKMI